MIGFELFRATHHIGRGLFNALAELGSARASKPRTTLEAAHRLAGAIGSGATRVAVALDPQPSRS